MISFTFFNPVVFSQQTNYNIEKYSVKTTYFKGIKNVKNTVQLSESEILELKQVLTDLNKAIDDKDTELIKEYENYLSDKGIINTKIHSFSSLGIFKNDENDTDVTNKACMFKAIGTGIIAFPIETSVLNWIMQEAGEEGGLGGIILAILLIIIFYVPVMLATHIIPFRVALPFAMLQLNQGDMTTTGLNGRKTANIETSDDPLAVNLSFFTGLTIGFPEFNREEINQTTSSSYETLDEDSEGGFLFVYGWAASVENA